MKNDVFISYSTADLHIVHAICNAIEEEKIKCWIAPRDIKPGLSFVQEIVDAIKESSVILLIFSKSANDSVYVCKEVTQAAVNKKIIIPFLIDDSPMNTELDFYLHDLHWLIAHPEYKEKIEDLIKAVKRVIGYEIKEENKINHEKKQLSPIEIKEENKINHEKKQLSPIEIKKESFSPVWNAVFQLLVNETVLDISKLQNISSEIFNSEGFESAKAFWDRLIEENKSNPLYYSGRAQLYEFVSDSIENIQNIVKDYSTAYALTTSDSKYEYLRNFYFMRMDDAKCLYYNMIGKSEKTN